VGHAARRCDASRRSDAVYRKVGTARDLCSGAAAALGTRFARFVTACATRPMRRKHYRIRCGCCLNTIRGLEPYSYVGSSVLLPRMFEELPWIHSQMCCPCLSCALMRRPAWMRVAYGHFSTRSMKASSVMRCFPADAGCRSITFPIPSGRRQETVSCCQVVGPSELQAIWRRRLSMLTRYFWPQEAFTR
jgi:hypothetical protein